MSIGKRTLFIGKKELEELFNLPEGVEIVTVNKPSETGFEFKLISAGEVEGITVVNPEYPDSVRRIGLQQLKDYKETKELMEKLKEHKERKETPFYKALMEQAKTFVGADDNTLEKESKNKLITYCVKQPEGIEHFEVNDKVITIQFTPDKAEEFMNLIAHTLNKSGDLKGNKPC